MVDQPDISPRPRLSRAALGATLVLALLAAGLSGWRQWRHPASAPQPATPVAVVATVLQAGDAPAVLDAVGSLRAVREVVLAPESAGRVTGLHFASGTRVAAGDLLVQLYDAPERADRAAALARVRLAQTLLARSRLLVPTGAEPKELLEQHQAELDQAQASVQQLDARIAQKQIRAPFPGVIGVRQADLGQYLNPGDAIAALANIDRLYVDFSIPQQALAQVRVGATVRVAADAWPGRAFVATVSAIEPRVDRDTRNLRLQATLDNAGGALRPGMHVSAALQLPPERQALVLPATAVQLSAAGDSVVAIRGDRPRQAGTAERVAVTLGRRIGDDVVVTRGLRAGDVVVTEGQLRIQPGAALRVSRLVGAGGH